MKEMRLQKDQQPKPHPFPLPQPPQQQRSRMIQRQLLSHPHPFPQPLPQPLCPQPPQQQRSRMIQRELFPHPHPPQPGAGLSHPHPQFVAAKSLMLFPPEISLHFQYMQDGMSEFNEYQQKFSIAVQGTFPNAAKIQDHGPDRTHNI